MGAPSGRPGTVTGPKAVGYAFLAARFVVLAAPVVFLAAVLPVVVFLAVVFAAVDFLAALVFFAPALFVAADVFAVVDVFLAEAFVAVRPVAVSDTALVAFLAAPAAALGSFFAPLTKLLKSEPGRNFGTDVFFTRTRSPVAGLRAVRAGRSTFSNTPNPVMTTFSPAVTVR